MFIIKALITLGNVHVLEEVRTGTNRKILFSKPLPMCYNF